MKKRIFCMAVNTVESFRSSAPHWVAYEVYRRIYKEKGIKIEKSSNTPGVMITLPYTSKHPKNAIQFQITPKSVTEVRIECVFDGYVATLDVDAAVNAILSY